MCPKFQLPFYNSFRKVGDSAPGHSPTGHVLPDNNPPDNNPPPLPAVWRLNGKILHSPCLCCNDSVLWMKQLSDHRSQDVSITGLAVWNGRVLLALPQRSCDHPEQYKYNILVNGLHKRGNANYLSSSSDADKRYEVTKHRTDTGCRCRFRQGLTSKKLSRRVAVWRYM